jgi:hypothetical protein
MIVSWLASTYMDWLRGKVTVLLFKVVFAARLQSVGAFFLSLASSSSTYPRPIALEVGFPGPVANPSNCHLPTPRNHTVVVPEGKVRSVLKPFPLLLTEKCAELRPSIRNSLIGTRLLHVEEDICSKIDAFDLDHGSDQITETAR